jgi:hypothetical protein
MPIQFRCLNCGEMISADDTDAGQAGECDDCGAAFKVPQPIGGKLTEKRLMPRVAQNRSAPNDQAVLDIDQVSIPTTVDESVETDQLHDEADWCFDPQNVPQHGFKIEIMIENAVYGRDERPWIEDSVEAIRESLLKHLDDAPQYFDRGYLLLIVHRWSVRPDGYDVNLRLAGLVNGEEFSEYFYATPESQEAPSLIRVGGLVIAIVKLTKGLVKGTWRTMKWVAFGIPVIRTYHYRLRKLAARDLQILLDDAAHRQQPFFRRVWRFLNSDV